MLRKLFVIVTIFTLGGCAEENNSKPQNSGNKTASSAKVEFVGRYEGKIKWFNVEKGFGFIQQESGPDVFLHFSQNASDGGRVFAEGQKVSFELENGQKGPQAAKVLIIE